MRGERDEAARDAVVAALKGGASVLAAARGAGVHRQAVYKWAERGDLELAELLQATHRQRLPGGRASAQQSTQAPPPAPGVELEALTDAEVGRLRLVGLRALEEIASDRSASAGPRAAAAKALQEVGERWAARAAPAAPPLQAEPAAQVQAPESDPAAVVAKFRVVS